MDNEAFINPEELSEQAKNIIQHLKEKGMSEERIYLCLHDACNIIAHSIARNSSLGFTD